MDVIDRLLAAVRESGLKRARIAEDAGMSPTKLSKILNGNQAATLPDFLAIVRAIGQDPSRLFTEGEMVVDLKTLEEAKRLSQRLDDLLGSLLPIGSAEPSRVFAQPKALPEHRATPVRAAANPNAELIAELETYSKEIPRRAWNRGARIIARVVGDSMDGGDNPLRDGDLAFLKPTRSPRTANHHITLLRRDDGVYLKILEITGRRAQLISANPDHDTIELDLRAENMQTYGYVVDVLRAS